MARTCAATDLRASAISLSGSRVRIARASSTDNSTGT